MRVQMAMLGRAMFAEVVMYRTPFCSYCMRAAMLLKGKGVRFEEIDVSNDPDTRERLVRETGSHTVPQIFLVTDQNEEWAQVLLPVRPNGTTGWVKKSDVRLTPNRFRIEVELGAHQITVYDGEQVMIQEPIAVGKESTPTPTGKYYTRVLLKAPDPNTVYGPYAYGLSGHSEVLTEFNGGDAELGIHGNNDASVLGQSVSAGCIRMSNESITRLAGILPLGTPVEILP